MHDSYQQALENERYVKSKSGSGKGDRPRKINHKRYRESWERIFGKKKEDEEDKDKG